MRPLHRLIACLLVSGLCPIAAFADDPLPLQVGRISFAEAGAGLQPGAAAAWSAALVNEPVMTGFSLRSGSAGRAEIRLPGIEVALAPDSEITIVRLDENLVEIALAGGRIGLRLGRRANGPRLEVDTARGGIWPAVPGEYDIAADAGNGPVRIAAFAGDVRFAGGGIDATIASGTAEVLGAAAEAPTSGKATADGFADWWRSRDDDSTAATAPDAGLAAMPGAAALAGEGEWQKNPDYGAVWFPQTVPDGWVPFRYGVWCWLPPWGWTWVDDAPWGFAPSHYGRWARIAQRWGWVPGNDAADPAYVPAVVDFLGTAGIGLSYAGGSGAAEAWFPLGPGEPYWPPRREDIAAVRRMNAGSGADLSAIGPAPDGGIPAAIINGQYRYRRFASAVPRAVFVGGRQVANALVAIPERRIEVAPLIPGGPQIGPPAPHAAALHVAAAHPAAAPSHPVAAAPAVPHPRLAEAAHPRLHERMAAPPRLQPHQRVASLPRAHPHDHAAAARSRSPVGSAAALHSRPHQRVAASRSEPIHGKVPSAEHRVRRPVREMRLATAPTHPVRRRSHLASARRNSGHEASRRPND